VGRCHRLSGSKSELSIRMSSPILLTACLMCCPLVSIASNVLRTLTDSLWPLATLCSEFVSLTAQSHKQTTSLVHISMVYLCYMVGGPQIYLSYLCYMVGGPQIYLSYLVTWWVVPRFTSVYLVYTVASHEIYGDRLTSIIGSLMSKRTKAYIHYLLHVYSP